MASFWLRPQVPSPSPKLTYPFQFACNEDGAVTVDWVVLTAAIIGLGFAVVQPIIAGATDVSDSVGAQLTSAEVTLNGITAQN